MKEYFTGLVLKYLTWIITFAVILALFGGYFATRCISQKLTSGGTDEKIHKTDLPGSGDFDSRKLPERSRP